MWRVTFSKFSVEREQLDEGTIPLESPSMTFCLCGWLEYLWERQHPDWVAFWCIYGNMNKPTLGFDFYVRAKRARTCFRVLFPSTNCLTSRFNCSQSFVATCESPSCGPAALNDKNVESNSF